MSVTVRNAVNRALMLCGHIVPVATYTTTAQTVADIAITELNHVNQSGTIDASREAKYYGMAIPIINDLQATICHEENPFEAISPISAISDVLSVSDINAKRIMPCGVAMEFARADSDILSYNTLSSEYYGSKLPDIIQLISGDVNKYTQSAVTYCNILQDELLRAEGKSANVPELQTINDTFSLLDDTASNVIVS